MIENVTIDKLDIEDRVLAELIGLDNFKKLVEAYGGSTIYIKKYDTIIRTTRDIEIKNKFNGFNYRELAKEYGLTVGRVRKIIENDSKIQYTNKL